MKEELSSNKNIQNLLRNKYVNLNSASIQC